MKKISNIKLQITNFKSGFTLIELLIVVAIIGLLSTLLMSNFVGFRQRGRDGQRKSDLRQIQAALEMYRSDNASYPGALAACGSPFALAGVTYMQTLPCDPLGATYYNSANYYYGSDGTVYTLGTCLENENDSQGSSCPSCPAGCSSGVFYVLNNP